MLSAPRNAHEFAQAFVDSEVGAANRAEVEAYEREYVGSKEQAIAYKESAEAEHAKTARNRSCVQDEVWRLQVLTAFLAGPISPPFPCRSEQS